MVDKANTKEQKMGGFSQFSKADLEILVKNTRAMGDQPSQLRLMEEELKTR